MSTRSSISIKEKDGTFRSIYCHWDGYPSYVGKKLVDFYATKKAVNQLLDLGDLFSLGDNPVSSPEFWESEEYSEEYCLAFKDRGDANVEARHFDTVDDVISHYDWSEYHYFFIGKTWYYAEGQDQHLIKVKTAL